MAMVHCSKGFYSVLNGAEEAWAFGNRPPCSICGKPSTFCVYNQYDKMVGNECIDHEDCIDGVWSVDMWEPSWDEE